MSTPLENSRTIEVVEQSKTPTPEVEVDASVADLINSTAPPEPEQVKEEEVVFVAFQDFDGRINQREYKFVKGVPVRCPLEEANTWLEAKKGYVK